MKILIVTRNKSFKIPEFLEKINNKKIVWKNKLSKEDFQQKNLVITIGGDGTFLSASHFIENQLILGVNDNPKRSEGHLTTATLNNLKDKLIKLQKQKTKIK